MNAFVSTIGGANGVRNAGIGGASGVGIVFTFSKGGTNGVNRREMKGIKAKFLKSRKQRFHVFEGSVLANIWAT